MDARKLKRGMKGYGLTVMRGQKIERFSVEVIGVLYNKFPGQDLILMRCSGLNLEHTGVIAGMSGSPVFVKDARGRDVLVGAVSYAFPFNKDPVAGVTPIKSMWPELSRPLRDLPKPQRLVDMQRGEATTKVVAESRLQPSKMRPIALPLSVAGFHPSILSDVEDEFRKLGFGPVSASAGGAGGAGGGVSLKSEPFKPGSAISLSLVRGDMSMAGVGTVTWVHGDRFIAFGHPFRGLGQVHLPVGNAHIVHVTASQVNSFKMGIPLSDLGILDQDRLPAVAGRIGPKAAMIPMKVRVISKAGGVDRKWNVEVVDQPKFFPLAVGMVLKNALKTSEPMIADAAMKMTLRFELDGGYAPLVLEDRIVSVSGSYGLIRAASLASRVAKVLVSNGFKRIRVNNISAKFELTRGRPMAFMDAIRPAKQVWKVGESPVIQIDFLRPNQSATMVKLKLPKLTKEVAGAKLRIWIGPASRKRIELPPPKRIEDVLHAIRMKQSQNDLVAVVSMPGKSWMIRGERLESLPPSVTDELKGHTRTTRIGKRTQRTTKRLPWVIQGSGSVTLVVADEE